jgi:hypothetical protein
MDKIFITRIFISYTPVVWQYYNSLRTVQSGDRISVLARFSAPFQAGPGTHPASHTMGTGSFPEVKRPGRGVHHPPLPNAEVKETVELYFYLPFWPSCSVLR